MYDNKKPIFIVSGVAGSGKGSVLSAIKNNPEYNFSISCTTRKPRINEIDGKDYHFLSKYDFQRAINNNDFLEWEKVHTDYYGTRKQDFEDLLKEDKIIFLELDVKGGLNIKKLYNNVILIFIDPPSIDICLERLSARNTEDKDSLEIRKSRYSMEIEASKNYDYHIINNDLATAQKELLQIIKKYS